MLNPKTINTIVVLSYGDATGRSSSSLEGLIERVRRLRTIQILAVPYRNPVGLKPLMDLVASSLGRSFGRDATNVSVADISKFLCQSFL